MSSVDVIVPCYRYGHYLKECVESVLGQSGPHVRVLILDDASPDNTAEIGAQLAREDSRVTFSRHVTNKGHIATYNEGIEWASADYLLLLSADDYLLPGALSRASGLMDAYPEVGFSFGSVIELSDDGATENVNPLPNLLNEADQHILRGRDFIEMSGVGNIVPTPTAVVRTELQRKVGDYRSQLPHSGDMEMWLRLAAQAPVGVIRAYQAVYRRHAVNMSLAYVANRKLLDLQQRKAAIDYFFQTCSHALPNAQRLYRTMLWELGCEATGKASAAFNDGDMNLSNELSRFAVNVCPKVKRSLPWAKFACKRRLGIARWLAVQPAIGWMRYLALKKDRSK